MTNYFYLFFWYFRYERAPLCMRYLTGACVGVGAMVVGAVHDGRQAGWHWGTHCGAYNLSEWKDSGSFMFHVRALYFRIKAQSGHSQSE